MKKLILAVFLIVVTALAWALPTRPEVEAEVQQGHNARAEMMMGEVIAAKPDSARAHFIYAEVLARNGKLSAAADEAKDARVIDPEITFTDPDKFRSFESMLARAQETSAGAKRTSAPVQTQALSPTRDAIGPVSPGVPTLISLVGLAGIAFLAWRVLSSRQASSVALPAAPTGVTAAPSATFPSAPPGPLTQGQALAPGSSHAAASGMLGVGLAATGGAAAGMLAGEMLNHRPPAESSHGIQPGSLGPAEANLANDLGARPVDFGTGGSDWDSGVADGGGSSSDGGWN